MKDAELNKIKEKVYNISSSLFPLDVFFNDIFKNNNPQFDKDAALHDIELIADYVIELQNKIFKGE